MGSNEIYRGRMENSLYKNKRNIMSIKSITVSILTALFLTGCVTTAEKVKTNTGDFFTQKSTNGDAIVFFTCGTMITKTPFGDFDMDNAYCNFRVNSVTYVTLEKGTVGKLSLAPGEYSLDQGGNTGNHTETVLKVNVGDVLLATANVTTTPNPLIGGLIGGATSTMLWKIDVSKSINMVVNKTPVVMTIEK